MAPHPEESLVRLLGLRTSPVAISFAAPPQGVPRVSRGLLASCAYWRAAAAGEVFYTEAADHHGCPIGAHTHGVPLPPEVQANLEGMLGQMFGLEYLRPDEVAELPTRREPFVTAVYAPLDKAPLPPDVVLVVGTPRQLMLLQEAAQSVGAVGDGPPLGRPTCVVLPQAISAGKTAMSLGCIGNRVYTGVGDDEAYLAIPGARLGDILARLVTMVRANQALESFHRSRQETASRPQS